VAEACTGTSVDCPPDTVLDAGTVCRASVGACDVAETCTGTSGSCPADHLAPTGTVCRAATGVCDAAETCTGTATTCPADAVQPAGTECRAAVGSCDVAELCDGTTKGCPPDLQRADGSVCDDASACTRLDKCQSGVCAGTPVVCVVLDGCHNAGTCDVGTGVCSNPAKANGSACDDGNVCTAADSCQAGVCGGLHVAGCCAADDECADAFGCTVDRCSAHACVHAPLDDRCGAGGECGAEVCMPADPGADSSGCVMRPANDAAYCTEDADPCTIDSCQAGVCQHQSDGSGPRCAMLDTPFRNVRGLIAGSEGLQATVETALAAGCVGSSCDITSGDDATHLVALLQSSATDLQTAALAISGRLAESSSPEAPRDPTMRAQLALGLLQNTPGEFRAFLATLKQARSRRTVGRGFFRGRRQEGTRLLRGTAKLRSQLTRIVTRHKSFAR
jgi:hypothetical protein